MIKDSGNRREFETGAVRDIQEGKGRCDLLPLEVVGKLLGSRISDNIAEFMKNGNVDPLYAALEQFTEIAFGIPGKDLQNMKANMLLELAKHFEQGAKKYGENNWQKGLPTSCYMDSAVRHYLKYLRGDDDEPHDRAFAWNITCCIWTCLNKPELNDYCKTN